MSDIRKAVTAVCLIIASLLAYNSYIAIMNGNFEKGLVPWWTDFAIANPMLFALILVGGTALLGAPFRAIFE
ncbi:hypothetical protein [Haloarcula sp. Atlit-7R]|uniref:hypothetical protein n=1 Tax=Haloarcula sp. Atlit-7R TaxID=2282125 RepID=UPI000EF14213|nr:hypothetical protein [Haloarcula sp. Atlit-7R]RLM89902.1 hypothetical protein D3D01_18485 [Haloarcula sp. Atlit-7R]